MSTKAPTYEELRAKAAEEWTAKQAIAGKMLADFHAQIAAMPDVRDTPSPDIDWSHPDIFCPVDAGKYFKVARWVTVNGRRHRAELVCTACGHRDTWDWATQQWMGG